jgi:hypothetical protein
MGEWLLEKVNAPFLFKFSRIRRAVYTIALRSAWDVDSTIVTGVHSADDIFTLAEQERASTYGMLLRDVVKRFPSKHVHDPLDYAEGWLAVGTDIAVGSNQGLFLYDSAFLKLEKPEFPASAYNAWQSFDNGNVNRFLIGIVKIEN